MSGLWFVRFMHSGASRKRGVVLARGIGVVLLGCWVLCAGCASLHAARRPASPATPVCTPCPQVPVPEAYGEVLALIEKGRLAEARKRLEAESGESVGEGMESGAVFELAAALLVEPTDAGRLKSFRDAFQRYASSLPPDSPARDPAERALRLLDTRIREAAREQSRTKALHEFVQKQQKELEDLEYKLRRLEEIQQETELKREDFLHR